ncbi:hypothetical protein KGF56_000934 [Candida oxycetoniae]|uniref:4-nitrophenylphosphatase n=1 Tax=Candida oxycetoniae TaxID=497107 RepID=A0AAI9SZM0_9ASCO|nr:uncharacterized protein KGF56_000934 [Candida oxycetoniae]KAI3406093.2 hypothetical protein KGF56_000934 [Candida oxycetoniae]
MTFKTVPVYINSHSEALKVFEQFDNFLLDCDGVIWLSEQLIEGVPEFLQFLELHKKNFAFVTNNSSQSRSGYIKKFESLGIHGIEKGQIYTTGYSAVLELKKMGIDSGSKVWVLGDSGIEEELIDEEYIPLGGSSALLNEPWNSKNPLLKVDPEAKAVIAGSTENFNFMRITTTLQYLMYDNKKLPYIGTNGDRNYPGPDGLVLPAGGSMVDYMSYCSNRPYINVGKPSKTLADIIFSNRGYDRAKTIIIGDTLTSDIKFGNDSDLGCGQGTMLVFSGTTTPVDLEELLVSGNRTKEEDTLVPRYCVDSLTELLKLLISG